ncbi:MAG: Uma2 family endonuclease [Chloroflexota bacterium]
MSVYPKYTSSDLESLPNVEGTRYEIIDGDLFVSKQPALEHQYVCLELGTALHLWSKSTGLGRAYNAPGLIFEADDDVAPDVIWISHEKLRAGRDDAGHIRTAPDLAVEVLSPGTANQRRDREFKLKLYSRQGVSEYWIVDVQLRMVQVYRRQNTALDLVATLTNTDMLTSVMLPGFGLPVRDLWEPSA